MTDRPTESSDGRARRPELSRRGVLTAGAVTLLGAVPTMPGLAQPARTHDSAESERRRRLVRALRRYGAELGNRS